MSQRFVALALLVVLVGIAGAGWWLQNGADVALEPTPLQDAGARGAAVDASSALVGVAADAGSEQHDGAPARAEIAGPIDAESGRPLPDDASRVTITVIDANLGEPVAGALVRWFDESAQEFLADARPDLGTEETQEMQRDGERLAQFTGWSSTTDKTGQATVTLRETTTVLARRGDDYGRLVLRRNLQPPRGGHRLRLGRDRVLSVRVVSVAGAPEVDVPVTIGAIDKDGDYVGSTSWQSIARSRAPDGIATIRHLQDLQRELDPESGSTFEERATPRYEWRVRLFVPGVVDKGVPFAIDAPPDEPIELRLPACGSILVRSEVDGRPVPGLRTVWLNHETERHYQGTRTVQVGADGVARIRHVPIGQRYVAHGDGELRTEFSGPVMADQEVTAVLRPDDSACMFAGRLVMPDRTAVANQAFRISVRGAEVRHQGQGRTDAHGRFLVGLPASPDRPCEQIAFTLARKGERTLRCELAGRTIRKGIEELGDLVLGDGVLLCAGRVLSQGAPFAQPLQLRVERFEGADSGKGRWRRVENPVYWDGKGSFAAHGIAPPGRYRMQATSQHAVAIAPAEFAVGARDVLLEVTPGVQVAACALLPPGTPGMQVEARLVPAAGTASPEADAGRLGREPSHIEGERYHFQWAAVPAGVYSLELRLFAFAKPLVTVPELRIPVPSADQERLQDIDLRPVTRIVMFELLGPQGPVDDGNGLAFPAEQANQHEWRGVPLWQGKSRVLLPLGAYDVLVCVPGYRPQPVRGSGDAVVARLDTWPKLKIRLTDLPTLPPKARVSFTLTQAERSERKCRSPWSTNDLSDYLCAPMENASLQNGLAEVAIGDGPHILRVSVRANRRSADLEGVEPKTVLSTAGEVTVLVPSDSWKKAIETVSHPSK